MTDVEALTIAADLLRHAAHVVVLTGAGASAESGVPTFRDALTGLWEQFDPADLATPAACSRPSAPAALSTPPRDWSSRRGGPGPRRSR